MLFAVSDNAGEELPVEAESEADAARLIARVCHWPNISVRRLTTDDVRRVNLGGGWKLLPVLEALRMAHQVDGCRVEHVATIRWRDFDIS